MVYDQVNRMPSFVKGNVILLVEEGILLVVILPVQNSYIVPKMLECAVVPTPYSWILHHTLDVKTSIEQILC